MRFLFFLFGLVLTTSIFSQNPAYFNYSVENGAPTNDVYSIIQDSNGYIWIGTDAGVYRYNGVRFIEYKSNELTSKSATGLVESNRGRIYGYTFNKQLFFIQDDQLFVVKNWKLPITRIAADNHGFIWVTSPNGMYRIKESNLKIDLIKNPFEKGHSKNNFASQACSDIHGNIFYQQGQNILLKSKKQFKSFKIESKIFSNSILLSWHSSKPWVVDVSGNFVYRFNGKKFIRYKNLSLENALKGRKITYVFETENQKLWIATYSGIVLLDLKTEKTETILEHFSFSNGILDKEGNFWFSTIHNGIIRIPNIDIRLWKSYNEIHSSDQFSHLQVEKNNIHIGSNTGLIGTLNKLNRQLLISNHLPKSDLGMMYFVSNENSIYFNKMNELYRLKKGKIETINKTVGPLKSMLVTPDGYLFASSQGLFFTKVLKERITMQHFIDLDWYRDIIKSPFSGHYIAATNNGISVINKNEHGFYVERKLLKKIQILSLAPDPKSKELFLLSFEGIIYKMDKNFKLKIIYKLDSSVIPVQIKLKSNQIYLATNKGVIAIDLKQKKALCFNKYFGLASNNIRAIEFDRHNCWAIGDGLQKIPLKLFSRIERKGKIVTRAVYINGVKQQLNSTYQLNYFDNISLCFDGLSYRSNGDFDFAYRIIGSSNSWTMVPGKIEKIDFANLPSGHNSIEIKLIDHSYNDSYNTITLGFNVISPFWQRWWFYLLIALSTLALAFGIFRWRLLALRKKQLKELKRLRLENELRLTQQNALKAQMNPHFLFNVLNSIKGYIYENDKKNAAKYLSDFSSLVRKVLELSSMPYVSLDQELEALKIYIELEAMLLQSTFSYDLIIDEELDIEDFQVPPLILQPYVENAFKHGLRHKKGNKNLKINLKYNSVQNFLEIQITDNGIGRKASEILNKGNNNEHKSFATSAIEKRIKLLNYRRKDVVGVEITDKFEGKEATGTIVKIRIHV